MDIINKKLADIIPYAKNAKKHNKVQINNVAESIKQYGFVQPIVIDCSGVIVIGHCRALAAQKLGMEEVPCVCVDDLTPEQVNALRLVDNKSNESDWDFDLLAGELPGLDLSAFDFDWGLPETTEEVIEDEAPEVDEDAPPVTKLGDIWQLGRHRLMCGDSTDPLNYDLLIKGERIDLVFTDPPYGMKKESDGVANDNLNYDDLLEFNKQWLKLCFEKLKDTGCLYCWGIDEPLMDMYSHIFKPMKKRNELVIRNYITWAKHSAFGINSAGALLYPRETEKAWFVMKGQDWNNNNAEYFNTKFERILEYMQTEAQKVNLTSKELHELTGVQMWSHWFTRSQFTIIPEKHYATLQRTFPNAFRKSHAELKSMLGASNNPTAELKPYFDNIAQENVGDIGLTDVLRFPITSNSERELTGGHATPKPIALCCRAIKASSREDENVLDVFGGSGSTLIACEQLDRTCYMMELDPKYCDVIIKRWETLTGEKAVLLHDD